MLDNPEKTRELMALLEAAVPFEVGVLPNLVAYLEGQERPVVVKSTATVSGVSYLGEMGGISCHIQPEDTDSVVVVSLTHVRVPRTLPFARAALEYQKHRIKKLKKQIRDLQPLNMLHSAVF